MESQLNHHGEIARNKMETQIKNQVNIPNKRYFSIGEVSQICDLKTHVLRYWEQEFSQLDPIKRRGNRRYYQQKDLLLVLEIKDLLQNQGYTIEGAKTKLESNSSPTQIEGTDKQVIKQIKNDLEKLLATLNK